MKFNPEEYETVKERKKRFYKEHPDGRIIVDLVNIESVDTHALFKCWIYRNPEEQEKCLAWSTGFAHETRDTEKKVSQYGKEYESVNYSAWVENCEESAIGRALDNAGYSGNNKCSREEMQKATRPRELTEKDKALAAGSKLPDDIKDYIRNVYPGMGSVIDMMRPLGFDVELITAKLRKEMESIDK